MHDLVWITVMDHRYLVAITRTGTYQGELTIADGLETVYRRPVELMYNALLGSSLSDIADWQQIASDFVQSRLAN